MAEQPHSHENIRINLHRAAATKVAAIDPMQKALGGASSACVDFLVC